MKSWGNLIRSEEGSDPHRQSKLATTRCTRRTSIQRCVWIWLLICSTVALNAQSKVPIRSITETLGIAYLFQHPLKWAGNNVPSDKDSQELWDAFGINQFKSLDDAIPGLEDWLKKHTLSPWAPSLHANLGYYYWDIGRYSLALSHWQAAWALTQRATAGSAKEVGDFVLAHYSHLLAVLGRTADLTSILADTAGRQLDAGVLQQVYNNSAEAHSIMMKNPGICYQCGTYSLASIGQAINPAFAFKKALELEPSPVTGFAMSRLVELARLTGLDLVPVRRNQG